MKQLVALLTAIAVLLCAMGAAGMAEEVYEEVFEDVPEAISEEIPAAETPEEVVWAAPEGPALTLELRNVTLDTTVANDTDSKSMGDLWAAATLDTSDLLQLGAGVYRGINELAFIQGRLMGNRLQLTLDGLDSTYELVIPSLAGMDTSNLAMLVRALLPSLMGQNMQPIHAASFPKLDLSALAQPYVVSTGVEGGASVVRFSVPQSVVAEAFEQLSAALKNSSDRVSGSDMLIGLLDSYPDSGVRISLEGSITDRNYEQICEVDVMITGNQEAPESPTFMLKTRSVENSFEISFGMPNEGDTYELARFAVNSDTEADTMALSVNAMGVMTADLSASPTKEGLQNVGMNLTAFNTNTQLSLQYGVTGDMHSVSINGSSGPWRSFQIEIRGLPDPTGAFNGMLNVHSFDGVRRIDFSAEFTERLGESSLADRDMPEHTAPIEALTSEDLAYAFEPLTETLSMMFGTVAEQP